jgi:hypothetical protein
MAMVQVQSLIWLFIGASLAGITMRVTIPPFTWLALTFLLHASRSMTVLRGLPNYFAPGDRTLSLQVPLGGIRTLYARIGDLFAWLCAACLVVALGIGIAIPQGVPKAERPNHETRAQMPAESTGRELRNASFDATSFDVTNR